MNQIIIEFKTPKELAKKIAEYNDWLNPKQEPVESPAGVSKEDIKKAFKEQAMPVAEETKQDTAEPEVQITDFDGNVVEQEELELTEPVEEVQPFDWKEYKAWMSGNKEVALKVKAIFDNHGAKSYDSSALTDAIIADLQALRAEVQ